MPKYKIFVSGNQKELKTERFAVKEVVNNNRTLRDLFDLFLFEDLPAKGKPPVSAYLKQVDNSDIYIGIIGNEYGIRREYAKKFNISIRSARDLRQLLKENLVVQEGLGRGAKYKKP